MAKAGTVTQNDRLAAIEEFRREYNISPNAEQLIAANNSQLSAATREAQLLGIDHVATAELDMEWLAGQTTVSGTKVSDLGTLLAAAVRGNAISVVVELPDGRTYKDVVPYSDDYVAPREPAHLAAAREQARADADTQVEIARLREEMAADLAEHKASLEAQVAEQMEKLQGAMSERIASATEDAVEAEEKAAETPVTARGVGDASESRGGVSQAKPARKSPGKSGKSGKSGK